MKILIIIWALVAIVGIITWDYVENTLKSARVVDYGPVYVQEVQP